VVWPLLSAAVAGGVRYHRVERQWVLGKREEEAGVDDRKLEIVLGSVAEAVKLANVVETAGD